MSTLNLEKSVGSQKSAQAIDAPGKPEKSLITNKVTTSFSDSPSTPMAYTSFLRPTNFSRLNTAKQKNSGFTLLEVLIAVAIFAVISGIAYSGLSSVLKASHKTQAANRSLQELQLAMSLIHQDLTQITNRAIRDEFGQTQPALKSGSSFEQIITFTRRGWRNPAERARSTLQRVAYRLDEDALIREYWQHLDRAANPKLVSLPLLEKVKALSFRYYDEQDTWQQQWPPLSRDESQPIGLPRAVELTLDTEKWGKITRLFVLE